MMNDGQYAMTPYQTDNGQYETKPQHILAG